MSTETKKRPSIGQSFCDKKPKTETSQICRVCLEPTMSEVAVYLFGDAVYDSGRNLAEVIALLGDVVVAAEEDTMPLWCCEPCETNVEVAYRLRLLCQESDRKLRGFMPVKQEYVEETICKDEVDLPVQLLTPETQVTKTEEAVGEMLAVQEDSPVVSDDEADSSDDNDDEVLEETETKSHKNLGKMIRNFAHLFDEVPALKVPCCGCRALFDTATELQTHLEAVHQVNKPSGPPKKEYKYCDLCFKHMSRGNMKKHKLAGTLNFRCKECGEIFLTRKRVCMHYQQRHGLFPLKDGATFKCCCGQQFDTSDALRLHSDQVHLPHKPPPDNDRPFPCDICFKNFKSYPSLYRHRTRKDDKNHQCTECGRCFSTPLYLEYHELSHKGIRNFQCDKCSKTFADKRNYRKHVARHNTPHDRFKCEKCDRTFKNKYSHDTHVVAIHTDERPFRCTFCPAAFARSDGLAVHKRTHTGERNHECPQCGKRFPNASERGKHVKLVHFREKPFPCFFCERKYPRRDYRKRHMESAHPHEMRTNPPPESELVARRPVNVKTVRE